MLNGLWRHTTLAMRDDSRPVVDESEMRQALRNHLVRIDICWKKKATEEAGLLTYELN